MKNIRNKYIAVVGGGPGGLTLARLLQMRGAIVKVYERDTNKNARSPGATLDLHEESGLLALKEAGLMEAFETNYRPGADKMRVVDKHAEIFLDDHAGQDKKGNRPEIDRGPLQEILFESLDSETVFWNRHLVKLHVHKSAWELEFQNGMREYADLVIGADGARSKIRSYLTPIKPFYSGIMVLEGSVQDAEMQTPEINKLLKGGKIFALGDEKSLIVSSKGGGELVFYISWKSGENWSRENAIDPSKRNNILSFFKKEFSGWSNLWDELFLHAQLPFVIRPQYCMPLDQQWDSRSNIAMLGDAAHLMPPFAGEGVNMAMLDALELANCLTSLDFPDLTAAISFYEKNMLKRFAIVGKDTLDQTEVFHSPRALTYMVDMLSAIH